MPVINNVNDLLGKRTDATPDKVFLISEVDGRSWSYSEFTTAVARTAQMLRGRGIRDRDVVSLLLPNSAEYIIGYFACWHLGAIAGPVNSHLKPEEVAWIVSNSQSKMLMTDDATVSSGRLGRCSDRVEIVTNWPPADAGSDAADAEADITGDDEAIIIYTSGTTGKPKGCLLTHGNLIANARQITKWLGFGTDDRLLTVMPLFHMNAVTVTTMTALYAGGSTVVSQKFSASRFWDIVEKYQITSFGSVATMLSMLLQGRGPSEMDPEQYEDPRCESLRFAMCGSAPVPVEVLRKFEERFGVLVIEGYGLSESTCRATFNPPDENRRPGSCGKPIGNEMRVVDEDDNDVPDGELGEIVLRGPNIFKGYFKNPEATAEAFRGGWFHTGDIGYRDADGYFFIADRKSDMIIRGGENIYPREIDDVLYTHLAVAHAAVIGVPDELYGEEVAAFIVLKDGYTQTETQVEGGLSPGTHVSAEDIINFCKLHLADFKCPKTVYFVDDIPKGPTGKLLKRELANRFSRA